MKLQVLIVDDDERIRRSLRGFLESRTGWEVCGEAASGVAAVAKARELNPAVILMDFAMPEMDGLHAAKAIAEFLPRVPVVLHTMHDSAVLRDEAAKFGVRFVVAKGSPPTLILAAMESAVACASANESPLAAAEDAEQNDVDSVEPVSGGEDPPLGFSAPIQ
jgi:DNA-binding NarL/FixJ family response regulator